MNNLFLKFKEDKNYLPENIRYCIFSVEKGKEEERLHCQGYIELESPRRISYIKKIIGSNSIHCETRHGTREEARNYCLKSDTHIEGPYEFGEWNEGGQGKRNDLKKIYTDIKNGRNIRDIADENPGGYIRYHRGFDRVKELYPKRREWKTEVHLYYGKTNTGKTRSAVESMGAIYGEYYIKEPNDMWWDGYNDHKGVIIDDYRGKWDYEYLLRLLDRYAMDVRIKGGSRNFVAEWIVITSSCLPDNWYKNEKHDSLDQLYRRIDKIFEFDTNGTWHEVTGNTRPSPNCEDLKNLIYEKK